MIRIAISLSVLLCLSACGGGGGSGSSAPQPVTTATNAGTGTTTSGNSGDSVSVGDNLGLVSGGAGLAEGSGIDGVALVGVSGTGLQVGVSGTGLSLGAIQDFGSIVINDETLNTDNAEFVVNGQAATQADLRQGQQILVIGDINGGVADSVQYRANIIAPLSSLNVRNAMLGLADGAALAQTLQFDAATAYDGTEFEQLTVGTLYELSGIVDRNGTLTVTYVRPLQSADVFQLSGEVTTASDAQLTINDLTVDISSATLAEFAGSMVSPTDVVAVTLTPASYDATNRTAEATEVRLLPRLIVGETVTVEAEGPIDFFASPQDFDVQSQPVRVTNDTVYFGGDVDDLDLDEHVFVTGTADASGVLVAEEVFFESDDSVFVAGPVDQVDLDEEQLTVLGITFDLRDQTDLDAFDALDELQIGDPVEVVGYLDGSEPIAAEVELEDLGEGLEIRGPADSIDAAAATLEIFGVPISTSPTTEFLDLDDEPLSQQAFFEQLEGFAFVEANWDDGLAVTDAATTLQLVDD